MEHCTRNGFIFDLDGTLLDSLHVWYDIDKEIFRRYGKTYTPELSEQIKSMTIPQATDFFLHTLHFPCSFDALMNEIESLATYQYQECLPLKSGAWELLETLQQKSIPCCIATATYPSLAQAALQRLHLTEKIQFLITEQEVGSGKTDPRIFRQAAARLGCGKRQVIVVEDSLHAIQTAAKDGFFTVGVYEKTLPPAVWEEIQHTATITVQNLEQLRELLLQGKL